MQKIAILPSNPKVIAKSLKLVRDVENFTSDGKGAASI